MPNSPLDTRSRHVSVQAISRWYEYDHLNGNRRAIAKACTDLAAAMLLNLEDGPELTNGLRKLLEAKDSFVRQSVADDEV